MGSRTTSSFAYPVDLKQAEDGRFVARLPDLVGAVTDGNNPAEAMREVGIGNVELGRRLGVAENEIRRCLEPRQATKISRLDDALAALGRRLIVTVDAA